MFRTSYVHKQEDYIVHAALYGIYSMHLCKRSTRLKDVLVDCLHKFMENIPYSAACTIYSLPDDERRMFETCRRQEELN